MFVLILSVNELIKTLIRFGVWLDLIKRKISSVRVLLLMGVTEKEKGSVCERKTFLRKLLRLISLFLKITGDETKENLIMDNQGDRDLPGCTVMDIDFCVNVLNIDNRLV